MTSESNRRAFLQSGTLAATALGMGAGNLSGRPADKDVDAKKGLETVRVGFVGIGVKGSAHLANLLHLEGVEVRAVCDILEKQCVEAQKQAERLGRKKPTAYFRGELDFRRMCEKEELDLVYTATPWRWHTPICLAAMSTGSHAATEIPAAVTLKECWQLVETAEKTGRYCVMMENVNYQRTEMAVWNMIRKGLLGELVHCEAGYAHDTRYLKARDYGDGLWLGDHHAKRNGCLYPTHGLGPVCWYLDVNRGDRLDYLVSMSSNARGLDLYVKEHLPADHPKRKRKYVNGDVNACLIRTVNGRSIVIKHDTDLPRPYSRTNLVQGTRGIVRGYPTFQVCLEGDSHVHKWKPGANFLDKHDHPWWKRLRNDSLGVVKDAEFGVITKGAVWHYNPAAEIRNGDFAEDYRLIQALRTGAGPDFDVYDAATWSVVAPLSEESVAKRSAAVDFPDFTKGKWKTKAPLRIQGV